MSIHQMTQGYVPSLNSMFKNPASSVSPSLLFNSNSSAEQPHQMLYPPDLLPRPSVAAASFPPMVSEPSSNNYHPRQSPNYPTEQSQYASRPPPAIPTPESQNGGGSEQTSRRSNHRTEGPDLKTVHLPRDCLPRFLAIANVNTSRNRETCGLLLGKDKGQKFVVTTLLIPKQSSTSDTCTMDEEELVLQFTEERSLITLGWVGTCAFLLHKILTCRVSRYTHIPLSRVRQ